MHDMWKDMFVIPLPILSYAVISERKFTRARSLTGCGNFCTLTASIRVALGAGA